MNEEWKHRYIVTVFCAGDSDEEVHEHITSLLSDGKGCSILDVYTELYDEE